MTSHNLIKKIVESKKEEVRKSKKKLPLRQIKKKLLGCIDNARNFKTAIKKENLALIAEIKKASPLRGIIKKRINPIKTAFLYEKYGASAVSVVTEKKFFMGDISYIPKIRKKTTIPILRKDFIIDEYQIYESKLYGADAVLLIVGILNKDKLKKIFEVSSRLGIDCVFETHTKEEIETAVLIGAEIIGINNRDLSSMNINLSKFSENAKYVPKDKVLICESGIKNMLDARKARIAKADAILVGTAIMKSNSIKEKIKELVL